MKIPQSIRPSAATARENHRNRVRDGRIERADSSEDYATGTDRTDGIDEEGV